MFAHLGPSLAAETRPYLKINRGGSAGQEPLLDWPQISERREELDHCGAPFCGDITQLKPRGTHRFYHFLFIAERSPLKFTAACDARGRGGEVREALLG